MIEHMGDGLLEAFPLFVGCCLLALLVGGLALTFMRLREQINAEHRESELNKKYDGPSA